MVSSSGMTYANVVSVPTEEHNRYMTYITTYSPSGVGAFKAARTMLHMLRERIHILRKRPQDILRSPHPRCAVVASVTSLPLKRTVSPNQDHYRVPLSK
jgi:hypothetical protein